MTTTIKIGVILVYVGLITAIALYCGRGNKTFKDFAIGGAKIPWFIMAGTLFSTFCGGATMVAYVGNFYSQGMIWIWIPIQVSLVGLIYLVICRRIFNMRQISTADIMARRYGENTRLLSSVVVMIAEVGMVAAMMNTFAAMVTTYVGLSKGMALALAVVLFIATAALGGYKGVATTDALQGVIIFFGLLMGVVVFTGKAGG
ncbi:sodium:solute symporter family transporter, partial [Enterocloster asparagiformis]